jgi:type II secretory pathway pseudopilin PulG
MSESEMLPASPPPNDANRKRELDLREREVAAREREIAAKESEINRSPWLNPLVIGLLVAVIGLAGSIVVTWMNNQNSQRVERFRAQSILVTGAISTYQGDACRNLLSLVELKLLDDTNSAVQVCKSRSNFVNAPIPPIPKGGAPIGTIYQSEYKRGDLDCINETVKVSATGWEEHTASSDSPPGCQVDAATFPYTERESNDPQYLLLYDEGRNLFARLPNIAVDKTGPSDWRLVSNQTWNVGRSVTRVK